MEGVEELAIFILKMEGSPYKDLLNSNSKCLYITETIGHGSNIITGDYSVGATGFFS